LADGAFDQGAIDLMVEAYDLACKELQITNSPYEPANEAVAQAIIQLVRDGEREVAQIARRVVQSMLPPI
jgi:hypothetical protein